MLFWLYLLIAILTEVVGTTLMKVSQGLTRIIPTVLMFLLYGVSFVFMALALKKIEVSTAYAIWSGLGTALIAVIGIAWFRESLNLPKLVGLVLIVSGVILLNLKGAG
ncbi:MAG: multidrug efflux SMR transporter [Anaerolineales bacterium]